MKVSLAWIFDHINADWHSVDIESLVRTFNQTTAEIEHWYTIKTNPKDLILAQVVSVGQKITLASPDIKKEITLPVRSDVQENNWYLIKKDGAHYRWATSVDLGGVKEMIVPAVKKEAWEKSFEADDCILEIDNKSITHRPDLWGHRGFAREIAAILNLKLKPYDKFLAKKKITHAKNTLKSGDITIAIKDPKNTIRFSGLHIPTIEYTPSLIWMVTRLSRVDSRSIDAFVDFTNYVMLDTSQPMHAFDAHKITNNRIESRAAHEKEKLTLLDDQKLTLSTHDIVIADGAQAVSLAGIMGGKSSAVSNQTHALFLESANFDAVTIRHTSQRYHVRSEASARFEKTLDPMQNVDAILRFLKLLDDAKIKYHAPHAIASLGKTFTAPHITVTHDFITKRLGTPLPAGFVAKTLEKIDFKVKKTGNSYRITIPLFRASKDIALAEDIVEEVGRFFGYSTIPFVLPTKVTRPVDTHAVQQISRIKHMLAFGLNMRELYGYSFFDESFLREFNWKPTHTSTVKDPVSQNWYQLVTSLMPSLFQAIQDNHMHHDALRFFESGRVWHVENKKIIERKKLSGIFYAKKAIDFYDVKADLDRLFSMLKFSVSWQPEDKIPYPWFDAAQTARIMHEGKSIGIAGMVDTNFMAPIAQGHAFIFELDMQELVEYQAPTVKFVAPSKYPAVERDISMMVPLAITVQECTHAIEKADTHIVSVELIDFYQKKEWHDKKSLTFRYTLRAPDKTLTTTQADAMSELVHKAVQKLGATIR